MARRKGAVFLPLTVTYYQDAKIAAAGEGGEVLYVRMCCKSKELLTDGILTAQQIEWLHVRNWRTRMARCVEVGLVTQPDTDTYFIMAWDKHNDPAEVVRGRWDKDAARKVSTRSPNGQSTDAVRSPYAKTETETETETEVRRARKFPYRDWPSTATPGRQPPRLTDPTLCRVHMDSQPCKGCAADAKEAQA